MIVMSKKAKIISTLLVLAITAIVNVKVVIDKKSYSPDEQVEVMIQNDYDEFIYSHFSH